MKTEKICAPHCKKRQMKLSRKNRSGTRLTLNLKKVMKSLGRSQYTGKHERALLLISLRPTCYRYYINCMYIHISLYTLHIYNMKNRNLC